MPGKSTLPNRYTRVKASLACVASDDVEQMLTSEVEINKQIEAEVKDLWNKKWARIGKDMEIAGKQSYPVSCNVNVLYRVLIKKHRLQRWRSTTRR